MKPYYEAIGASLYSFKDIDTDKCELFNDVITDISSRARTNLYFANRLPKEHDFLLYGVVFHGDLSSSLINKSILSFCVGSKEYINLPLRLLPKTIEPKIFIEGDTYFYVTIYFPKKIKKNVGIELLGCLYRPS